MTWDVLTRLVIEAVDQEAARPRADHAAAVVQATDDYTTALAELADIKAELLKLKGDYDEAVAEIVLSDADFKDLKNERERKAYLDQKAVGDDLERIVEKITDADERRLYQEVAVETQKRMMMLARDFVIGRPA